MNDKTKQRLKIGIGLLLIIVGWLSFGIGYTIKSVYNTYIFLSGFVLVPLGVILLFYHGKKKVIRNTNRNTNRNIKRRSKKRTKKRRR